MQGLRRHDEVLRRLETKIMLELGSNQKKMTYGFVILKAGYLIYHAITIDVSFRVVMLSGVH
jgi:hypothetical protein